MIKQPLQAAIMRPMYGNVAGGPRQGKNRPESQTMAFGENDFLIEAYATDMTDKLAIVKEFSCGASRRARVLFV